MRRLDYKRQLIEYFKRNLKKGYNSDTLKWALISQDYSRTAVEQALEEAQKELAEKAPVFKEKPVIKYQLIDENNNPIHFRKPFWKRLFK